VTPVCADLAAACRESVTAATVVASGGTATTLAAVQLGLRKYDGDKVHGFSGSRDMVAAEMQRLWRMSSAQRRSVPGIGPGRAELLPTGLLVLERILTVLQLASFKVTIRGLRFGLALQLLHGEIAALWQWGNQQENA
jgi:exopolyphosphatase/guanosine-5'-triphosphate,3'-diphosphate pyrophosphatase